LIANLSASELNPSVDLLDIIRELGRWGERLALVGNWTIGKKWQKLRVCTCDD
jgi:hypothetical protein